MQDLPTAGPIIAHAISLADLVRRYAACYCGSLAVQMDHLSLYALVPYLLCSPKQRLHVCQELFRGSVGRVTCRYAALHDSAVSKPVPDLDCA